MGLQDEISEVGYRKKTMGSFGISAGEGGHGWEVLHLMQFKVQTVVACSAPNARPSDSWMLSYSIRSRNASRCCRGLPKMTNIPPSHTHTHSLRNTLQTVWRPHKVQASPCELPSRWPSRQRQTSDLHVCPRSETQPWSIRIPEEPVRNNRNLLVIGAQIYQANKNGS